MIYSVPAADDPLRQGDIFFDVPRIEFSLNQVLVYDKGDVTEASWDDLSREATPQIIARVRPVAAIVATQDCDAVRAPDVTLCEIRGFRDVERKCKDTVKPQGWKNIITQQARLNFKWFYLPPSDEVGLSGKMAVDFQTILRVKRTELEERRATLRRARLNDLAGAHFRERLAEFFRRYAYDEWYPLDLAEMKAYLADYPDAKPFPWQSD